MVDLRSKPGALFFILHLRNLPLVLAGIVNRTIDDGDGDSDTLQKVTYFPTILNVWQNASCAGCAIQPNITMAFKETYTAATYNPQIIESMSIKMKFNGKWISCLSSFSSCAVNSSPLSRRYCHLCLLYSRQQCWGRHNHVDTGQFHTRRKQPRAFPTLSESDTNGLGVQSIGLLERRSHQCRAYSDYLNLWCGHQRIRQLWLCHLHVSMDFLHMRPRPPSFPILLMMF